MRDLNRVKDQRIAELERVQVQHKWAERRVQEALRYAESIIETTRQPLVVLDANLTVLSANRSFYDTFKVTPEETLSHVVYELGNGQWDTPELRMLLEGILPEEETFADFEVIHDFKDIGRKIMLLNGRRIYRKELGTETILLAFEDITARKRLENLLRDSEECYRRIFETATDGILLLEKSEGNIAHANPAFAELSGYRTEEAIGKKLQDVGVLPHMGDFQGMLQVLEERGIIRHENAPIRTKAGQDIATDIYLIDKARLVQCNIRDITERKTAENALQESETQKTAILNGITTNIALVDKELRILWVNKEAAQSVHKSQDEMIGRFCHEFWADPSKPCEGCPTLRAFQTRKPEHSIMYTPDGRIWDERGEPLFDASQNLIGVVEIAQDVTESKKAEKGLLVKTMLLEAQSETSIDGILAVDSAGRSLLFNKRFGELWKIPPHILDTKDDAKMLECVLKQLKDPEEFSRKVAYLYEHCSERSGETIEFVDGRYLDRYSSPMVNTDGQCLGRIWFFRDITERRQAEDLLKKTLESLSKAVSATIQVMVSAVEAKDPYTSGHQNRVAALARAIATEMGLPQDQVNGIGIAGSIHDIGKLSVPAETLSKPTKLTDLELGLIKVHSQKGYDILKNVESCWPLAEIVYQHHERMDGSGYPRNLKGEDILMEARILAIADVVEAMASHRPYRPALGVDAALEEIEENKGILYDPEVSEACIKLFREKGFTFET